jgi:hypothetical protein
MAFTGEADNSFLAEYISSMESSTEVEEFVAESFGDAPGAARFALAFAAAGKGGADNEGVGAGARSSGTDGGGRPGGGRNHRGVALDKSMLGFSVSAPHRDRHHGE